MKGVSWTGRRRRGRLLVARGRSRRRRSNGGRPSGLGSGRRLVATFTRRITSRTGTATRSRRRLRRGWVTAECVLGLRRCSTEVAETRNKSYKNVLDLFEFEIFTRHFMIHIPAY
uniref:(northern house mosquito) hypothetical protein n=1 Tax=Culex pipiens TaxID=7175 RepID=A0A8D8NVN9_CULPI